MNISELKGIGEVTEKLINRLGVFSVADLVTYYPYRYESYGDTVYIADMKSDCVYAFYGTVVSDCEVNLSHPRKPVSVWAADETGRRIRLTWFNCPYIRGKMKRGYRFVFRGKVAFKGNLVFMQQPKEYTPAEYDAVRGSLMPVYSLTNGLSNNTMIKAVSQALKRTELLPKEYLSDSMLDRYNLIPLSEAVVLMHFPESETDIDNARKRIVFDEFFLFILGMKNVENESILANNEYVIQKSPYSATILANLTHKLTNAQLKAYDEMIADMTGARTMNRLIQGDVGCGKTILALLVMADAAYRGYQAALMAPTEVLAKQHYENFTRIFEKNNIPIKCTLLTGSLTKAEHNRAYESIESGDTGIVIGTHAVITDKVQFKNLALVITDEQHRFGVRQREALHSKGSSVHILVMSATPIPRSLAIILYGGLSISIIDEKPAMRLPIKNCVVDDSYRPNAYRFIEKEVKAGHQAYIICPMATESESDSDLKNTEEYTKELQKQFPPAFRIEYLHGKMRPAQKNSIMDRFGRGEIDILVSTTVVEVGINVPNATVMMVENAERFGLSALHQLRGRVGRGDDQSYCIFVNTSDRPETTERLMILKNSNDGFFISEEDLRLRGPGDLMGVRQSGDMGFTIGDIYADAHTLKLASDAAKEINLSDEPELSCRLSEYMNTKYNNINL